MHVLTDSQLALPIAALLTCMAELVLNKTQVGGWAVPASVVQRCVCAGCNTRRGPRCLGLSDGKWR